MKKSEQESRTKIPHGMATHLPEGASLRRYAQETILSTFFRWGYKEVVTPVFEYLDVLSAGLSSDLLEKSYKFVDRESGKLMLLRPDITPQVARMVAGILACEPKPLRLCYYGNVFRYEESHAGREREIFQVGCELAGISSSEADAEIISVASDSLRNFGLEDFKIVIGHVGYINGIISCFPALNGSACIERRETSPALKANLKDGLFSDNEQAIQEAISKKNEDLLLSIFDLIGVKGINRRKLLQIPDLFGGEEILDRAVEISDNMESSDSIKNIRQIYNALCLHGIKDNILIDLCDLRGIDYYTGPFFEIFSEGMPYPVGRGGRYDNLIGKFGYECPSTGFAIDVDSIITAKERQSSAFFASLNASTAIGEPKPRAEREGSEK